MIRTQITLGIILMIATIAVMGYSFAAEESRMVQASEAQVARRIERGAELFHTACARCHGEQAEGVPGLCPPINNVALLQQRVEEVGWAGSVQDYIISTIKVGRLTSTRPDQYQGESARGMAMPFWGQEFGGPLRDDQIEDIALFLLNYGEQPLEVAAGPTPTPIPEGDTEALVAAGLEIYQNNGCAACHALSAAGSSATTGPSHDGLGATAAERIEEPGYTGDATTAAEYIHESIVEPGAHVVEGFNNIMPPFDSLPEDQINALVEMLLQQ